MATGATMRATAAVQVCPITRKRASLQIGWGTQSMDKPACAEYGWTAEDQLEEPKVLLSISRGNVGEGWNGHGVQTILSVVL